jgi:hypothetical protein
VPCTSIWTSYIFPGHLIYYRQCLLRFGSSCRVTYPHCQDCSGHSDHDIYPLAIGWGIELVLIGNDPDQDSADDYPDIWESTCGDPTEDGRLIVMVAPTEGLYQYPEDRVPPHSSSKSREAGRASTRCHISCSFGPHLPVEVCSGATTCPTALDLVSLLR